MSALRFSTAVHRGAVRVEGEDRVAFLQGLISNDVTRVSPGQAIHAALLTPQGRFLWDMFVVATAVNGVPDLVEPGCTGLLATPGDPSSMARSVLWLLEHPAEAAAMGAAGRERVRSHFSAEVMCRALDELYSDLVGQVVPETATADKADKRTEGADVLRSA